MRLCFWVKNRLRVYFTQHILTIEAVAVVSVIDLTVLVGAITFLMSFVSQYFDALHIYLCLILLIAVVQLAVYRIEEHEWLILGLNHPPECSIFKDEVSTNLKVRFILRQCY